MRVIAPPPLRYLALEARAGLEFAAALAAWPALQAVPRSLVGWSLGGIYARGLARRFPESVRQVIALASPIRDPFSTRAYRAVRRYRASSAQPPARGVERVLRDPLSMPCTSIYSRTDGIVHWRSCLLDEMATEQNVEVESSHLGMGHHPLALYVIADRLKQPEAAWTRFEWPAALRWLAPNSRDSGAR